MQPKFKIGDVVVLKSGSPKMTINNPNTTRYLTDNMRGFTDDFNGTYQCKWFENDVAKEGDYAEDALVLVE